ncbi:MAG: hypothetical protein WC346_18460 [Methanogenium sp.]|jgi:hypothetical protein
MNERLISTAIILIAGVIFAIVRRFKNEDPNAGKAVIGWSLFSILIIWIDYFSK